MSILNTGSFPQDLRPGIRVWFGDAHKDYATEYDKIFEIVSSDGQYEEDAMVSGFGMAVVKPEGSAVSYDTAKQMYAPRYRNITYGLGFVITQEMMEDGLAMKNGKRFSQALKRSLLRSREVVSANVLNNAFSSTVTMVNSDGVNLVASTHPTRNGNQSNIIATAADISEAALETLLINIGDAVDDRGLKIMLQGRKLIIPSLQQFNVERILKSNLRVDSANNDVNAVKSMGMLPEGYMVNHYLTDNDAWFIKTDCPDGLKFQNRKDMVIDSDNDHDTNNARFKALMRFAVGWSDFRGVYGSAGA